MKENLSLKCIRRDAITLFRVHYLINNKMFHLVKHDFIDPFPTQWISLTFGYDHIESKGLY